MNWFIKSLLKLLKVMPICFDLIAARHIKSLGTGKSSSYMCPRQVFKLNDLQLSTNALPSITELSIFLVKVSYET